MDALDRWRMVTAGDLMKTEILSVPLSATPHEIRQRLVEHGVSGLGVTDARGKVVGVVSWRDVVAHFAERDRDVPGSDHGYFRMAGWDGPSEVDFLGDDSVVAGDVMSSELLSVPRDANLAQVAAKMVERGVHRLFVTEGASDAVVGVLSTMDIMEAMAE